ncbi:hypothetical protein [Candidatus Odyssella acanthamoebae]|uniref:Uncharacterized protein n=1 Tax=Candidatus Odyssella acanthamoebae TaxID=91604 RepID=A0A077AZU8_9PROT|nr:hypothetical protein [Candidatus Paracaedibacter acanthamoebae]AIK97233.1 hypothetical protein ID47_11580 [Candidatus Paracaedibacter acanthamoebae]
MKLIMLLLSLFSLGALEPNQIPPSYPDYSYFQASHSPFPQTSAPYTEETFNTPSSIEETNPLALYFKRLIQPSSLPYQTSVAETEEEETMPAEQLQQLQLLKPAPTLPRESSKSLEEELASLTQENKDLKDKIDIMATLLAENNQMLKALLPALHDQGIQLHGLENGQIKIEDHLINMMQKLKHWKTEMTHSHAHSLMQILKWFKVGFNISTSVGTAVTTYYTIAYFTAVLPSALTPPGWILLTTSATTGALYYIASAV